MLTDYILGYIKKCPALDDSHVVGKRQPPTQLKFNVTNQLKELIDTSAKNINRYNSLYQK